MNPLGPDLERQLARLSPAHASFIRHQLEWMSTARLSQLPPEPDAQVEWLAQINRGREQPLATCENIAEPWSEFGVQSGRGFGKGLALDTPIPTPVGSGWTTMGALKDGDAVLDCYGLPCRVEVAHAPYQPKKMYLLVFSDGSKLRADGDHLWIVVDEDEFPMTPFEEILGFFTSEWHRKFGSLRDTNALAEHFTPGRYALRKADGTVVTVSELLDIPPETVRCITIDAPEALYLAGEGMIPTHNTRMGAEWLLKDAWEDPKALPRCVIAPTQADVKHTCFEGVSGLVTIAPKEIVANYNRSELILELKNGAIIRGFSAEKPERLRGPEHAAAWCFPWDTPVYMADGTLKAICAVKRGDTVATRHGPRRVLRAGRSRNPSPWVVIHARAHTEDDAITLRCTADHPVWANGGWVAAVNLRKGDELEGAHLVGDPLAWLGSSEPDGWAFEKVHVLHTEVRPRVTLEALKANRPLELKRRWKEGEDPMRPATIAEMRRRVRLDACYSLTVEGEHEFIAGGIVVHNCDELAAWGVDADDVLDMMLFGLRIGDNPRFIWTSTPKPIPIVRKLTKPKAGRIVVRGSTYDNRANLNAKFLEKIAEHEGTRLGRQEIHGELIDPEEAGIIRRSWLRLWPAKKALPAFTWIVMSLDTAFTEKTLDKKGDPDPTACGVFGIFEHEKRTNIMLLDCWSDHLGFPDLVRKVKKEASKAYGDDGDTALIQPLFGASRPRGSGRKPDLLIIEDKGSGISLRQALAGSGIETHPYNPGRADKLARLHIVSPIFAQKRFWLPESDRTPGAPRTWTEPLIDQLTTFAGSGSLKHDDFVDVTTQAVRICMDNGYLAMSAEASHEKRDREREQEAHEAREMSLSQGYKNPYDC